MACVYPTKASVPIHMKGVVCRSNEPECAVCPLPHGKAVTIDIYTAISFVLGEVPRPGHLEPDDIHLILYNIAVEQDCV